VTELIYAFDSIQAHWKRAERYFVTSKRTTKTIHDLRQLGID